MPPVPSNRSMVYPAKTSPLFNGMPESLLSQLLVTPNPAAADPGFRG